MKKQPQIRLKLQNFSIYSTSYERNTTIFNANSLRMKKCAFTKTHEILRLLHSYLAALIKVLPGVIKKSLLSDTVK